LRIQKQGRLREWEVNLLKPVRLGRLDPNHDIFPEVDLTEAGGMEHGVSREHACIFERLGEVEVEDLGSTNGTLLNGQRLAPYIPHPMCSGDRLQLGKLELEIIFESG
jgi:pSer/pThr/pTyr-binding forkhead associated (FHA) protein